MVAYVGRAIDGREPRYKVPAGFQESLELFNFHDGRVAVQAQQQLLLDHFEQIVLMVLEGQQPDQLTAMEIHRLLEGSSKW